MPEHILNFEEEVIEKSRTVPVLVDFWAPWCGPCRVLGPVLEQLAAEQAGRWELVKINTDEYPELSRQFGIRGIPAVKLFHEGTVIDEFTGALPDHAIRQWLDKALPTQAKKDLKHALSLIEEDRPEDAKQILEDVLREEPTHPNACAALARLIVHADPARARKLADTAETGGPQTVRMAQAVRTVADILEQSPDDFREEKGADRYLAAIEAVRTGHTGNAIPDLIEVLKINRYLDDDGPKRLGVALFTILGDEHPVTLEYRRTFDMWLY